MEALRSHVTALAILCPDCGQLAWQYVSGQSGKHVKGFLCKAARKSSKSTNVKRGGCGRFIELDKSLVIDPNRLRTGFAQAKPTEVTA